MNEDTTMTTTAQQTPAALIGETIDALRDGDNKLAIAEYNRTESALQTLEEEYHGVVYDVADPQQMKDAKEARRRLTKLRTGLEKKRQQLKRPVLDFTKALDGQAKSLTQRIKDIEDPIDAQIRREEQRQERERIEREEAERKRLGAIRERIEAIRNTPAKHQLSSPPDIEAAMDALMADKLEGFEELETEAAVVRDEAVAKLFDSLEQARQREAERAELEELRRFKEEQDRKAREEAEAESRRHDQQLQQDIATARPCMANAIPEGELAQAPRPEGAQNAGMATPAAAANVGIDPGAGDDRTVEATVSPATRSPVLSSFLSKYSGQASQAPAKAFYPKELRCALSGDRSERDALEPLFGDEELSGVFHDEHGTEYTLELTLRRVAVRNQES